MPPLWSVLDIVCVPASRCTSVMTADTSTAAAATTTVADFRTPVPARRLRLGHLLNTPIGWCPSRNIQAGATRRQACDCSRRRTSLPTLTTAVSVVRTTFKHNLARLSGSGVIGMYCPQCGTHSLEYSKFCHGCGAALPTGDVTALEARQSGVASSSGAETPSSTAADRMASSGGSSVRPGVGALLVGIYPAEDCRMRT